MCRCPDLRHSGRGLPFVYMTIHKLSYRMTKLALLLLLFRVFKVVLTVCLFIYYYSDFRQLQYGSVLCWIRCPGASAMEEEEEGWTVVKKRNRRTWFVIKYIAWFLTNCIQEQQRLAVGPGNMQFIHQVSPITCGPLLSTALLLLLLPPPLLVLLL